MGDLDLPVLFIAGKGRSGSTVLSLVLDQLDGVVAGGELRFVWRRGMIENRNCGCGETFADCPRWSTVTRSLAATGDGPAPAAEAMTEAHAELFRWLSMPRLLVGGRALGRRRTNSPSALSTWADGAARLYRSVASAAGASVVVDSSKWPMDPAMLGLVPGIRPIVVHLVRDPRAVAWSWQRTREQHDLAEVRQMDRFGPVHSTVSWLARNLVVEVAARRWGIPRVVVRYEDFVDDPTATIERISTIADVDLDPTGVVHGRSVNRSINHTVAGNPARFGEGPLELRPDDEWHHRLPAGQRRLITAIAAPLLSRYGYPTRI